MSYSIVMEGTPLSVTVILSAFARDYFDEQIPTILAQTIKPDRIILYQNASNIDLSRYHEKYGIEIVHSIHRSYKYEARFLLPLLLDTEFCTIIDDDTFTGPKWIENALRCCQEHEAIVGSMGWILDADLNIQDVPPDWRDHRLDNDTEVDYVGHSWTFRTEWVRYFWGKQAPSRLNGEDIHFSAAAQVFGMIRTYVARQPRSERGLSGDLRQKEFGVDEHASWRMPGFHEQRREIARTWMNRGWVPLHRKNRHCSRASES
jgi:hypothetical protein